MKARLDADDLGYDLRNLRLGGIAIVDEVEHRGSNNVLHLRCSWDVLDKVVGFEGCRKLFARKHDNLVGARFERPRCDGDGSGAEIGRVNGVEGKTFLPSVRGGG
jgi:hypothetical protein